ncbi:MAG: NAD(P)-dependent oxidoreductase [Lachnospiraceae bacterium]|nr:NAD(P)-dependent oxidoreductase [Lachnospiraceae bacterium]
MSNRKVIVTGATSFIGMALIEKIRQDQQYGIIAVVAPDSLRKGNVPESDRVQIVESDMKDIDMIDVKDMDSVEIIYHIAWSSRFSNPRYNREGQLQNVDYLEKVIHLGRKVGCKKIMGIGSQAECGRVSEPITEATPNSPENAYAAAKCYAYERGMSLCEKYGIDFYWPRILSAYGPGDLRHTMIMSCLNAAVHKQKAEFTKCGQIWDYVYVGDVAEALIGIADRGVPGIKYTIASGQGKKLADYVAEIAEITDAPFLLEGIGKKEYIDGQVMYLVGDISRLRKDTGFHPATSFTKGICATLEADFNFRAELR